MTTGNSIKKKKTKTWILTHLPGLVSGNPGKVAPVKTIMIFVFQLRFSVKFHYLTHDQNNNKSWREFHDNSFYTSLNSYNTNKGWRLRKGKKKVFVQHFGNLKTSNTLQTAPKTGLLPTCSWFLYHLPTMRWYPPGSIHICLETVLYWNAVPSP